MRKEYQARLQCSFTFLEETLEVDPVMDLCHQRNVLNLTDMERLRAERSRPDRVVLFLRILGSKTDDRCYETFREVLDDPRVNQAFLGKQIDETTLPDQIQEGTMQIISALVLSLIHI